MKVYTVACNFDNYAYILACQETGEAAVIDPAEYYPLEKVLDREGLILKAIYCTHHHPDHIGGLKDMLAADPNLNVFCHSSDLRRIAGAKTGLEDRQSLALGNLRGEVLHTPGHTSGSVCYFFDDALFTGDTLFGGGCGRLFEGDAAQLYQSLTLIEEAIDPATRIYFGHEYTAANLDFAEFIDPENEQLRERIVKTSQLRGKDLPSSPSTLALELATNPFLRCSEPDFILQIRNKLFLRETSAKAIFAALRTLKDGF